MLGSKRNVDLDVARGVAIIMVVFGHAIQYTSRSFDANFIFKFIYAVHMPLFMFISGFLAIGSYRNGRHLMGGLRSYAKKLIMPFIAWIPINFFVIIFL